MDPQKVEEKARALVADLDAKIGDKSWDLDKAREYVQWREPPYDNLHYWGVKRVLWGLVVPRDHWLIGFVNYTHPGLDIVKYDAPVTFRELSDKLGVQPSASAKRTAQIERVKPLKDGERIAAFIRHKDDRWTDIIEFATAEYPALRMELLMSYGYLPSKDKLQTDMLSGLEVRYKELDRKFDGNDAFQDFLDSCSSEWFGILDTIWETDKTLLPLLKYFKDPPTLQRVQDARGIEAARQTILLNVDLPEAREIVQEDRYGEWMLLITRGNIAPPALMRVYGGDFTPAELVMVAKGLHDAGEDSTAENLKLGARALVPAVEGMAAADPKHTMATVNLAKFWAGLAPSSSFAGLVSNAEATAYADGYAVAGGTALTPKVEARLLALDYRRRGAKRLTLREDKINIETWEWLEGFKRPATQEGLIKEALEDAAARNYNARDFPVGRVAAAARTTSVALLIEIFYDRTRAPFPLNFPVALLADKYAIAWATDNYLSKGYNMKKVTIDTALVLAAAYRMVAPFVFPLQHTVEDVRRVLQGAPVGSKVGKDEEDTPAHHPHATIQRAIDGVRTMAQMREAVTWLFETWPKTDDQTFDPEAAFLPAGLDSLDELDKREPLFHLSANEEFYHPTPPHVPSMLWRKAWERHDGLPAEFRKLLGEDMRDATQS
jgi:hypothetical protein